MKYFQQPCYDGAESRPVAPIQAEGNAKCRAAGGQDTPDPLIAESEYILSVSATVIIMDNNQGTLKASYSLPTDCTLLHGGLLERQKVVPLSTPPHSLPKLAPGAPPGSKEVDVW